MDLVEERKPFDAEIAADVPETMPDPDELLDIKGAGGRVWVVKVSQYLQIYKIADPMYLFS